MSRAIENAQQKVEAYNFDIRKHVVEYDDVLNRQRDVIYGDRDRVLFEENLKPLIMEWVEQTLVQLTSDSLGGDRRDWDMETLRQQVERIFPIPENFSWDEVEHLMDREEVVAAIGKPDHKVRERDTDGNDIEDWIYGQPPSRTVFVRFTGERVTGIKQFPQ